FIPIAEQSGLTDVQTLAPPLGELPDSCLEHPTGQFTDETGLLGVRDELDRRNQPILGVLPADERLGAGDLPGRSNDLRLVVQQHLAGVNGAAQTAGQRETTR